MLRFGFVVDSKQLESQLEKLTDALDVEEILDEAGALLLNRMRTRFLAQTAPDGTKWPPSKAGLKRKAGSGGGTLFDTGRLFRAMQLATEGPNQRAIVDDVEYGPFHQYGTRHMPQRMFMGFNEEDADVVEQRLLQRMQRILG